MLLAKPVLAPRVLKFGRGARRWASDFRVKRTVSLPAATMFDVVKNIGVYCEFLPYLKESRVLSENEAGPTEAILRVGWQNFDEQFHSNVDISDGRVVSTAVDTDMFKELRCEWLIKPVKDRECFVDMKLRYHFKSDMYNAVAHSFGPVVARKMVEAFTSRAMALDRQ